MLAQPIEIQLSGSLQLLRRIFFRLDRLAWRQDLADEVLLREFFLSLQDLRCLLHNELKIPFLGIIHHSQHLAAIHSPLLQRPLRVRPFLRVVPLRKLGVIDHVPPQHHHGLAQPQLPAEHHLGQLVDPPFLHGGHVHHHGGVAARVALRVGPEELGAHGHLAFGGGFVADPGLPRLSRGPLQLPLPQDVQSLLHNERRQNRVGGRHRRNDAPSHGLHRPPRLHRDPVVVHADVRRGCDEVDALGVVLGEGQCADLLPPVGVDGLHRCHEQIRQSL
mmetsp:Transcript_52413/g.138996  ORF Transcript_52413/g.138996 Transcript_52413/m.138996 type:complete len:276 (+) Transcript_52413:63-890(+)